MTSVPFADQFAALRSVVFEAIESWNTAHPRARDSQRERAAVNLTQSYTTANGAPSYSIIISCSLIGGAQLIFHGSDRAALAEQARLTFERKIGTELQRRADAAYEDELNRKFDIAS
ncbi:MAG: hypothetical protein ABSB70_19490 [Candidatus Velthaea sp.]|jgi:hypothetical protein